MPSTIKLRVLEARDLPIMDRKSGLADAYVEVKFGELYTHRTEVCRKTLRPVWNQIFRIEVPDDIVLQDESIELKVWDKDIYSADDSVGVVVLDLNCLLMNTSTREIKGWFPIFDTVNGVRGYLHLIAKLQFFGDINPFKDSAAGVHFFSSSTLDGFQIVSLRGFVEELVVEDDPEYHWADTFRTSRTSNEGRLVLLYRLASVIRRIVGSKALELGCNAVLGYRQSFDFEGESGMIARGTGTACVIDRVNTIFRSPVAKASTPLIPFTLESHSASPPVCSTSPPGTTTASSAAPVQADSSFPMQRGIFKDVLLLTVTCLPASFHLRIGGIVSARSVKLLGHKDAEQEKRDRWWIEIRDEIRSHAKALNCDVVLGYTETTSICDSMCLLSGIGTAVLCDLSACVSPYPQRFMSMGASLEPPKLSPKSLRLDAQPSDAADPITASEERRRRFDRKRVRKRRPCSLCHITYSRDLAPFRMSLLPCRMCGRRLVPDMLLTTLEAPDSAPILGVGQLLEARVCRRKKRAQGEVNARLVSELIPFIEFDIHRQLLYKMRILGMNAAFALHMHITVGEDLIVALASATAASLAALPTPPPLRISRNIGVEDAEDRELLEMQRRIVELSNENCKRMEELASNYQGRFARRASQPTMRSPELPEEDPAHLPAVAPAEDPAVAAQEGVQDDDQEEIETETELEMTLLSSDGHDGIPVPLQRLGSDKLTSSRKIARDLPEVFSDFDDSDSDSEKTSSSSCSDSRQTVVLQIDDETDEDILTALLDPSVPTGILMSTSDDVIGLPSSQILSNLHTVTCIVRLNCSSSSDPSGHSLNRQMSASMHDLYASISYKLLDLRPLALLSMKYRLRVPNESTLEVVLTAQAVMLRKYEEDTTATLQTWPTLLPRQLTLKTPKLWSPTNISPRRRQSLETSLTPDEDKVESETVLMTAQSYLPQAPVTKYLGRVHLHFIKESWSYADEGGLSRFTHQFLAEAHSVLRANVLARGGNGLLSYCLSESTVYEVKGNQVYAIMTVSGDAVHVHLSERAEKGYKHISQNWSLPLDLRMPPRPDAQQQQ